MDINVTLSHQKLRIATELNTLIAGTQNFIRFVFKLPKEWESLLVFAQFVQNNTAYNVYLDENNSCMLPPEIAPGTMTLMLCGNGNTVIATTNYLTFTLIPNHLISDASSTEITQSLYDQLVDMIQEYTKADVIEAKIENVRQELLGRLADKASTQDLNGEITRATEAENEIRDDIEAETTRAIEAEAEINTALNDKVSTSDLSALNNRVVALETGSAFDSIISDEVAAEIQRLVQSGEIDEMSLQDGTLTRAKVDTAFEATLVKADTAMQPSVYDPTNKAQDIFAYTDDAVSDATTTLQTAINNYVPYTVTVVNNLPQVGADRTFYLVPKASGNGYDKWWYVDDENNNKVWDSFSGSSTLVVDTLPVAGDPDADYILNSGNEYSYFKYIDNGWRLIAGSSAEILTVDGHVQDQENGYTMFTFGTTPPSASMATVDNYNNDMVYLNVKTMMYYIIVETEEESEDGEETETILEWSDPYALVPSPSRLKDYYVQDIEATWNQFRYLDNTTKFVQIGSSAYTRDEIDAKITAINQMVANAVESVTAEVLPDPLGVYVFGNGAPGNDLVLQNSETYLDVTTMRTYHLVIEDETSTWEIDTVLVENPVETKDYYVKDKYGMYCHFIYINDHFSQVGTNTYTREEIDLRINNVSNSISQYGTAIQSNTNNILSLSQAVGRLRSDVDNIDTEGNTYYHTITKNEETGVYTFTLYEVDGEEETVASQTPLPATGGGGGQTAVTTLTVDKITSSPLIITTNDRALIEIDYSSVDEDGETYGATYQWKSGSTIIQSGSIVNQGRFTFDLTDHCVIGTQKFSLIVTDEAGSTVLKSWTIQKVDIRIESNFSDRYVVDIGKTASFTYTPFGAVNKTVHFMLDGVEDTLDTNASGTLMSYTIPAQQHGSHLMDAWITATVNGVDIETNHVYKDIIWYDPTQTNEAVIGCIYRYDYYGKVTARQYDTTAIVYNVFDPSTNYPTVRRYVDGELVGTDSVSQSQNVWNFQSDDVGEHELKIVVRNTTVTIKVQITELGIDVSPITGGLEIDFNPIGITNNSENRIWENDNYHMTVSENFDWANGGYKTDENGDSYFLIKAGTSVEFDYEMFSGGLSGNPSVTGQEMKIIFMTENVQDADAVWLSNVESIVTENEIDGQTVSTTTNMGIQMGVHEGWLKTNKASDTAVEDESESIAATNTYLYMPYSEEDIIEMDINIDPLDREDETSQAFVMAYEDGVPSKAYVYDNSDRFYQYDPQPLKIGSKYCDVRIYRLKIYSTSISTEGIMRNFIADARNSSTMLSRYDRNSIYYDREHNVYTPYSGNGVLDPERLAPVIPNVKVLMLSTDHFTTSKKTFVKSTLRCIHAAGGDLYSGDPYYDNWLFENGWHSGQGTTSDNYGNAGRNVDFLFNCDGTHNPSDKITDPESNYISQVTLGYQTENAHTEVIDDWKGTQGKVTLTRTSIPNNFFNLKVNIASSENVNNALMQKRYNDFLPYISPAKRRDSRIKNDMEFVPAILFLRETNPDITTHNEFLDTEWHFYALGNLGDSKKTDYTRAYDPTDMNEFTIEISDNTKNNATFQTGVYDAGNGTYGIERFHIVKTLDKNGKLVVTPVPDVTVSRHIYPVPKDQQDTLLFSQGTIQVDNQTGDPQYDGNETGYLNMRIWCLYNEGFDGDHSFEPRYACCGDYRDGKLVNDYSGNGKQQVKVDEKVWREFYKWVITSTDTEFVNELDQWCVRNAMEFFYAFTHYYTMMDNRAKNTFWHFAKTGIFREVSRPVEDLLHVYCEKITTEVDGETVESYEPTTDTEIDPQKTYYTQYAFDIWDYDNDTAIGIDNNGELVFPYGKEDTDYNIDGNPSSGWVFNGATSVFWCRLRDLLSSEIRNIYNSVSSECFSATNLINQFDAFQECFPEEIWRLDIQRKYIRTFTGESVDNSKPKHDVQYLRDMMQGRKKYQRRQWVRSQEIYFGTMNLMNTVVGDNNRITFRCFTPTGDNIVVPPDYTLHMTPYYDMYLSVMFGNGGTQQIRAKAGVEYTIECPLSTMDDTQVTIYGANAIQALNDLSACYIAANNFSMATKLRKLVLGNTTEGYNNSRLISLTLGNNKLLEELDIRNCGNLTGAINLAQCNNLLKLYAEGTRITSATFATNSKVQIIHLPNTINTLTMRNLNNLTDFQAPLDYLDTLTLQGGALDNLAIVQNTIDTLRVASLYDVNWTIQSSTLLNQLRDLFESQVTGSVYVAGPIRMRELDSYNAKWSDLTVTYDPQYMVEQYLAQYVNYDGTVLYEDYFDRGSVPIDPVESNKIPTPTRPSTAQYTYTFSGWNEITSTMMAPRTIVATYSETVRVYTVNWYSRQGGQLLKTAQLEYGAEGVYDGDIPTYTDEESTLTYNVFIGWDKSTGFIKGNTNVYGQWDRKPLPPTTKELKDMSVAEIYGLGQAANMSTNPINLEEDYGFEQKDYIDINVGNDFSFSNVESELLLEERWFDGRSYFDTNIKLFDTDSPSFTLAVDFEYYGTTSNATLIGCYSETGSEGFRVRYGSGAPVLQWGDKTTNVGVAQNRGMLVLRHQAGSDLLYSYVFNLNGNGYDNAVTMATLNRSRSTETDMTLMFGAVKFIAQDGVGYDNYASGWIHWAKIWYEDLGNTNAMELAAWPHETWRAEYFGGTDRYRIANSYKFAKIPLILNNLLQLGHVMNSATVNTGGFPSMDLRTFINDRVYNALPVGWRSILKPVRIGSSAGNRSTEIVYSEDKIFIPSYSEISSVSNEPYVSEGSLISWFTSQYSRMKFPGQIIGENSTRFSSNNDPTTVVTNNVKKGDVWYQPSQGQAYIYVPQSEASTHVYQEHGYSNQPASDGGMWIHSIEWWTRSPLADNVDDAFVIVSSGGYAGWYGITNYSYGIQIVFAV